MKHTMTDLYQMQGMSLEAKIEMTKRRIRDWVDHWGEDGVYVSFSGGKDSTVLLDLVRQDHPSVVGVFVDTGLEYPQIRDFVRTFDNIEWLRPKMTFKKVIEQYGYPFISKEVAECVYGARKYLTGLMESDIIDRPTDRGGMPTSESWASENSRSQADTLSLKKNSGGVRQQVPKTPRNWGISA